MSEQHTVIYKALYKAFSFIAFPLVLTIALGGKAGRRDQSGISPLYMLGKSGCGQRQAKQGLLCCSHFWELTVSLLVRLRKKLLYERLALLSTDTYFEHTGLPVAERGAAVITAGFGFAPSLDLSWPVGGGNGKSPRVGSLLEPSAHQPIVPLSVIL